MNWQVDELASWWNENLIKYETNEVASAQRGKFLKWPASTLLLMIWWSNEMCYNAKYNSKRALYNLSPCAFLPRFYFPWFPYQSKDWTIFNSQSCKNSRNCGYGQLTWLIFSKIL